MIKKVLKIELNEIIEIMHKNKKIVTLRMWNIDDNELFINVCFVNDKIVKKSISDKL